MELKDMHLVRAADVSAVQITLGARTQALIQVAFTCQHHGRADVELTAYLSPDAARAVALQLLETADRAEGRDRTRPAN